MDRASKIFYALLTLFALVLTIGGLVNYGGEGLAFGLFAFLTIGGGLLCIFERSVVRSAFSLLATFSGTAGLFLLLGSDFLAVAQILIYVGGILALLLFGVMLSPPDLSERKLARVLGGLALVGAGTLWLGFRVQSTVVWATAATLPPIQSNARAIGVGFLAADQYMIPFELAAVVLTVALVAAVYVARRKREDLVPIPNDTSALDLMTDESAPAGHEEHAHEAAHAGAGAH
jgi:NADH:ubiquinone oxidoreductase subunit 6 (subunit J)